MQEKLRKSGKKERKRKMFNIVLLTILLLFLGHSSTDILNQFFLKVKPPEFVNFFLRNLKSEFFYFSQPAKDREKSENNQRYIWNECKSPHLRIHSKCANDYFPSTFSMDISI